MKFHLTRSFPVPASRLWQVAVEEYADSGEWDRSVHSCQPVPDAKEIDGIDHSRFVFETSFGRLTVQILEASREGDGGVMSYTIADGLPGMIRDGRSVWTISSAGPDKSTLNINVELATNSIGLVVSPILKMIFLRGDKQLVDDLYDYLETGAPSEAKQKAIAKRRKQ